MGPTLVLVFGGVFGLAIVQAVVRRRLNPCAEVSHAELPGTMRAEIDRILPGFACGRARATRRGDEARVEGTYRGETVRVEADFDASGRMVDFEIEGPRSTRSRGLAAPEELPAAVMGEIERVLGDQGPLERMRVVRGTAGDEACFEVKGLSGEWKWEIAVSESGRLLEVERELLRR